MRRVMLLHYNINVIHISTIAILWKASDSHFIPSAINWSAKVYSNRNLFWLFNIKSKNLLFTFWKWNDKEADAGSNGLPRRALPNVAWLVLIRIDSEIIAGFASTLITPVHVWHPLVCLLRRGVGRLQWSNKCKYINFCTVQYLNHERLEFYSTVTLSKQMH